MAKNAIPKEIQQQVQQIVESYNRKHRRRYQVSFRSKYCYLSRLDNRSAEVGLMQQAAKMFGFPISMINTAPEVETKIGRLEWTGDMNAWDFAVFRYSNERYDEEATFFMPGTNLLDGTIEGAMKAGHEIYP